MTIRLLILTGVAAAMSWTAPVALARSSAIDDARSAGRFAQCQAEKFPSRVRAVLDAPSRERLIHAGETLEEDSRCYNEVHVEPVVQAQRISIDNSAYRGMLAEGLLREDGRAAGLGANALRRDYAQPWMAMTGRAAVVDEMAACMAEVNPSGIAALFKTEYGTVGERNAFGALNAAMGQCLQSGVALNADALALRTAFAEALYHRVFDESRAPAAE